MKACLNCGHSNPNANKFCRECGEKFTNNKIPPPKSQDSISNKSLFIIAVVVILCFIIWMNTSYEETNEDYTESAYVDKKILIKMFLKKEYLRDPDSYEPISWSKLLIDKQMSSSYILHKYRSKNGFGGFVIETMKFYFDKDGNIYNYEKVDTQ